ncbi:ankyrin repeat domain-containing protein [Terracidiphilus gabretensis]|uniref:ankyrin repeat domain-containing protein n=1 Tax=Terracidiphilus gabretensis TaxID=1577687 RepID=UPI00071BDD15|nr:ankyrin repeat domain-containing protein [Terracidiphilus gabretensis]
MAKRHFPVRPNLIQLKHQAKDFLRALHRGEAEAVADFVENHPKAVELAATKLPAKLADAQLALARSYGLPSWPRLVTACQMTDAIWRGDVEAVRALVLRSPELVEEDARGVKGNWGPPLSYAANLGQDGVIEMLRGLGAADLEFAFGRACLQGRIETARKLHAMMGGPIPSNGALDGAAYTLSVTGTSLLLELGARVYDENGGRIAPVDVVLGTDSRRPEDKHRILELYAEYGFVFPDTLTMALHRGRIDLLEEHLRREPELLTRTFRFDEIYPPEMGCHDELHETYGTPLGGTTLLHMCADYGELEIARWLLERGMNPDARAAVDADGFGGHTALFSTVVSQTNFWMNHHGEAPTAPFTQLLLEYGADPNVRASLRKELHPGYEIPGMRVYRNVTPRGWGEQFHFQKLVNRAALELIATHGGVV